MSVEVVSILVLCLIFLIATLLPVHMGALAIAAAFIVGMFVLDGAFDEKVDTLVAGFPGDLFVILAGVGVSLRARRAVETGDPRAIDPVRKTLINRGLFLLAVGFVANLLIRPVASRFHEDLSEQREADASAAEDARESERELSPASTQLRLVLSWAVVLLLLGYGVYETVSTAANLI